MWLILRKLPSAAAFFISWSALWTRSCPGENERTSALHMKWYSPPASASFLNCDATCSASAESSPSASIVYSNIESSSNASGLDAVQLRRRSNTARTAASHFSRTDSSHCSLASERWRKNGNWATSCCPRLSRVSGADFPPLSKCSANFAVPAGIWHRPASHAAANTSRARLTKTSLMAFSTRDILSRPASSIGRETLRGLARRQELFGVCGAVGPRC